MLKVKDRFFSSAAWTGRRDEPVDTLVAVSTAMHPVVEVKAPEPPEPAPYVPLRYTAIEAKVPTYDRAALAEYIAVANEVGVAPPDLHVEEFKAYLIDSGMTVFSLETVVQFMDDKSKAEGRGWGWEWLPLRDKDRISASFGTPATRREMDRWTMGNGPATWRGEDRPASDHYSPHRVGGMRMVSETTAYSRVVPLHALRKVAQIEREFPHHVAFMVSDYAPAPEFKADPFLMAVINNGQLGAGVGRFVIDVWDEPGFGIEHMLKSDL